MKFIKVDTVCIQCGMLLSEGVHTEVPDGFCSDTCERKYDIEIGALCSCGGVPQEDHDCPYAADINGDCTTMCNCCRKCEQNCSDEI